MAPGTNAQNSVKHSLTNAESPRHPENLHEMHPASRGNYGLESSGGYTILPAESSLLELPMPSQQCTFDTYNAYPQNYSSFSTYLSYLSSEGRGHR